MKQIYMRYPQGKSKALTFSYDDGVDQDKRLVSMFRQYGIKGTFNFSTGLFNTIHSNWPYQRRMSGSELVTVFKDGDMEIAAHSHTHREMQRLDNSTVLWDILQNRKILEDMFGMQVQGFAYPMGTYNDRVVSLLPYAGILYARTAHLLGKGFSQPDDWLRWIPTCHHSCESLLKIAGEFVEEDPVGDPYLFSVWGHSYEFDANNNWNVMEQLLNIVTDKSDIWYAANMEIYRYTKAFNTLEYSADGSLVTNHSALAVWILFGDRLYQIEGGSTLFLN